MESQSINMTIIILVLISSVLTSVMFVFLHKRQQQKQTISQAGNISPRTPERFTGGRVYSLALRGKYKLVMRLVTVIVGVMPVIMMLVFWKVMVGRPVDASPIADKLWIFGLATFAWSGLTILFLRAVIRHRAEMKVTLTSDGVRYTAPKVRIIPGRDVFIPWDQIASIDSKNPQHPSVITVSSSDGNFHFDSLHAVEVSPYAVDGECSPVDNGNDLHHDLLLYSGLLPQVESAKPARSLTR